jgi:hypothetical protein
MEKKNKEAAAGSEKIVPVSAQIPTAAFIGSKKYRQYGKDFLKALLPKPSYTAEEADKIITSYFKGGTR